jgi:hypothetical protein
MKEKIRAQVAWPTPSKRALDRSLKEKKVNGGRKFSYILGRLNFINQSFAK